MTISEHAPFRNDTSSRGTSLVFSTVEMESSHSIYLCGTSYLGGCWLDLTAALDDSKTWAATDTLSDSMAGNT